MTLTAYRQLDPSDTPLLETATLGNFNWCGERFTMSDLHATTDFAHYAAVDPSRGDFGIVAMRDGQPAGVIWALFLPSDSPGYGFVDEETPEVSLWVDAPLRGQGIGRQLMREMTRQARERGLKALSLSVEEGNLARYLYASEGYVPIEGREDDGVMILELLD